MPFKKGIKYQFMPPQYVQNRFYNRETIAASNYVLHQMVVLLPYYANQVINPFLNSRIFQLILKWTDFQPMLKSLLRVLFLYCIISFICAHQ